MPALLFHDAEAGAATPDRRSHLGRSELPAGVSGHQCPPARHGRPHPVPHPRARAFDAALPRQGEDVAGLGRQRPAHAAASMRTRFKEGIKGSRLVSIPEAGHMVTTEKTARVIEAIGAFA